MRGGSTARAPRSGTAEPGPEPLLPNFLCIGAQKCGTTSLCKLLEGHPDVYVSTPRETRFFVDEAAFALGLANYELGPFGGWNGQAAVGEKSPDYMMVDETPARVRAVLGGDLRLIVCLRRPSHRAHSHWRHNLMMRVETLPFEQALEAEAARIAGGLVETALYGYRHRGLYARRLEPWLASFDRERFLFLKFETMMDPARSQETADAIFAHLGVASRPVAALPREGRPVPPSWRIGEAAITAETPAGPLTARRPSPALRAFAAAAEALDTAPPPPDALAALDRTLWGEDIARLGALTGLEFDDWLT